MSALAWQEIRSRAVKFQHEWKDETSEHAEAKSFWDAFFDVFGISRRRVASFEKHVKILNGQGFIDLLWKGTLLIEHKSKGKNLDKAYLQAMDYFPGLTNNELPKYILVSDFERFVLYDLDNNSSRAFTIHNFHEQIELFAFMAGYEKIEIKEQSPVNIKAAENMGLLHDKLKDIGYVGHNLEVYLVRLLFCMFADDTGIFERNLFRDFILNETRQDGSDLAAQIEQLFYILNTPDEKRLKNVKESLLQFPYVNGDLFAERLDLASFDSEMRQILLDCSQLNWSLISPAIFGSLFQSVMNPEERRNLGAHYTSEENILKLIKPLFLDELYKEFEMIKSKNRQRDALLEAFHNKLSKMTFFDPACGCGNFLIIAYREIRLLELDVIRELLRGQMIVGIDLYVKVNVDQFYGIEIEEFPSQIAQVAMWLIDHQMNLRVSEEFGSYYVRLPLRKRANILNANSLKTDWNKLLPASNCTFILGNPPFIGYHLMSDEQKQDVLYVANVEIPTAGLLDFVCAWFIKSARYMEGNNEIKTAFVSTNSISQGTQALILWEYLFNKGIEIFFAHQTFKWTNEATSRAAVYCVIVGFSYKKQENKYLFIYPTLKSEPNQIAVSRINQYLLDALSIFIKKRSKHLQKDASKMTYGCKSADGGHLNFTIEEYEKFIIKEPNSIKYFKKFIGATELISGTYRYILYLKDCPPNELRQMPYVLKQVEKVREMRLNSTDANTRKWAEKPTLMQADRAVHSEMLIIPRTTSENRKYIPISYYLKDAIASDAVFQIANASLFLFGVLNSAMHMAWTRTVCGRLKGDYRYSNTIVYNNFILPNATENQKASVEKYAKEVLTVRDKYFEQGNTLADLYDSFTMPPVLLKAHQDLDRAVEKTYRSKKFENDNERLEFLFNLYQENTLF
ncbi:class I SAM-dependent DNA methyltransferase [Psychrobacillus psychrotolerans]|uniref:class I SAM-dependent DNA methyltransferase n=1 Tax=Psychrobacillus psychrotolerans TaxID=126156 RepID=UPI003B019F55